MLLQKPHLLLYSLQGFTKCRCRSLHISAEAAQQYVCDLAEPRKNQLLVPYLSAKVSKNSAKECFLGVHQLEVYASASPQIPDDDV